MEIREYDKKDKAKLMEMVKEILGGIFNGNPAKFKVLQEFNSQKDYLSFLVTIIDNKIVGCMGLKKVNGEVARLKRMYVRENYQRRGIAQKMLNKLTEQAKQKGYKKIVLSTYPIMENAQSFYKRNGFFETNGDDPEQIHVTKYL